MQLALDGVTQRLRVRLDHAVEAFPRGGLLPDQNWKRRHHALSLILLWHVPVLLAYSLDRGTTLVHAFLDASIPLALGTVAFWKRPGRGMRSVIVATGLISCSVVLVHVSGGLIEAHFHFFVVVALLSLYQDWKPFLVAIGLTVIEHGVTGVLAPHAVYNHPDAWAHPWKWAFIHGGFVLAASAASLTAWSISEADHRERRHEAARQHAQREAMLSHEARHDELTGLPNRRMVSDRLEAAAGRAAESSTMIGVLFIDLDNFKAVNDGYGHLIGDVVLKVTADRLRAAIRGSDMAARLGGDEFVIVCENLQGEAALTAAIHRVDRALSASIPIDGDLTLEVGATIGHVLATSHDPWQDLIERADLDMYRLKHLRRSADEGNVNVPKPR
jgi:diguanylate cyclase (GGDEF)-like protein